MTEPVETQHRHDEPGLLTPKLDARYALRTRHVALVALFTLLVLVLSHVPLRHTDLWGHVAYGHWILQHGQLPSEDPFMPLAEGMTVVDTQWLSQVIFAWVETAGGAEGLSTLFALAVLAGYLLLARVFYLQTRSVSWTIAGTLLVLILGWSRLTTIRPEMFAVVCFAALMWLLTCAQKSNHQPGEGQFAQASFAPSGVVTWLAVPLVMMLWANLHGSFVCGLVLLGCLLLGRVLEVVIDQRSFRAALGDAQARRWLLLVELAAVATLVNPYGLSLLTYVAGFPLNGALKQISEWAPMVILGTGGREFAFAWVLIAIALRHSRRRVHPTEILLIAAFSIAAVMQHRMMAWFAPAAAWVLLPHLTSACSRWRGAATTARNCFSEPKRSTPLRLWGPTLVAGLVVWVGFSLSGFRGVIPSAQPRPAERLFSTETPRGLTDWLRSQPAAGQVWNPQWWGDWLAWDGPSELSVFMTSHVHLVPPHVWSDYLRVQYAERGWESTLGRYNVKTVVVDKRQQRSLASALRAADGWHRVFEDHQAVVYTKRAAAADPALVRQRTAPATAGRASS